MAPPSSSPPDSSIHVYSDASGTYGSGAFVAGLGWFQTEWPEDWEGVDIASKELVPVVVAAALWGRQWSGSHVCFQSDNMAVVAVLNNRSAKNSLLAHLLRCFSLFSAYFAFHFSTPSGGVTLQGRGCAAHIHSPSYFAATELTRRPDTMVPYKR